jgi:hypothetical protein
VPTGRGRSGWWPSWTLPVTSSISRLRDHILIGHALLTQLHSVDADVAALTSIGTDPTTRGDTPASDHASVIARFTDC